MRNPFTGARARARVMAAAAVAAVLAAGVGIGLVISGLNAAPPAAAPMPAAPFTETATVTPAPAPGTALGPGPDAADGFSQAPSETADPASAGAAAPPADLSPNRVYIPQLGVDAPTVPIAVADGRLDPPADPQTVGWNAGGGRLDGDTGSLLLTSHVNYVGRGLGAFYHLSALKPNADVWTTDGQGRATHWSIVQLTSTPKTQVVDQTIFSPAGPRRLVLVTCGGQVRDGNYDLLVIAYGQAVDA